MNQIAPLKADKSVSKNLKLVPRERPKIIDVQLACEAVAAYASVYRSTPGFENCDDIRETRLRIYDDAVADLMRVLTNGA